MKKRRLFVLAFLLVSNSLLYAGAVKNAFAALSVYDYFKARTLFTKAIKHDSVPCCYGLSVVLSRSDYHFCNVDTAYMFLLKAKDVFSRATMKQKKNWRLAFGVDSSAILRQKDTIELKGFKIALSANSIDGYNHFIKVYPTAWQVQNAIDLRD
ncbi:MAG TPA: hypothetical protein VNY36_10020, partial [Bacteroidia bacterium]|nr:hypothetical protein [Bacteroidia bacterium]